jgi:hypothetical protein
MLEIRRRLYLSQESLGPDYRSELRPKNLDCNAPVVLDVLRKVDRRHPARTNLPLDAIAVSECCSESRK